jgi:predicted RNA-binding Zn-ribbon protein involved in translation (DUF1610 family)
MNVSTATTAELLAFFNANTGGAQVKKFADRKTAERRVTLLIEEMAEEGDVVYGFPAAESAAEAPKGWTEEDEQIAAELEEFDHSPTRGDVEPTAPATFIPSYNHKVCPKCGSTEIYNGTTKGGKVVHEDKIAGCHSCDWEQDDRYVRPSGKPIASRPAMSASMKLDRQIVSVATGIVYKNACQVWKAGLVSASQGDRLSATLYGAAKAGNRLMSITLNGHVFALAVK